MLTYNSGNKLPGGNQKATSATKSKAVTTHNIVE
jgi:hypothetical protein